MRPKRFTAEAVRHALSDRAEDLFCQAWGEPQRPGAADWRAKTSSALSMEMRGPKRGLWHNHKTGEGGDLLDFFAVHVLGLTSARDDFSRALAEAGAWCGLSPEAPVDLSALQARRAEREAKGAAEERAVATRKAALVAELVRRAQPVEGSPAEAYLANRGVGRLPDNGLAHLPPCPDLRALGKEGCHYAALVVWARDAAGTIVGGQRILILPDGSAAPGKNRKPSFGRISGFPARFPATSPGAALSALVVAEGPETALAIWLATGLEVWAVFGASAFLSAPLPIDRKVILCPDRDAPGSQAARGYGNAVAHHLKRGVNLRQADASEPEGSKRDLNDTLRRAGEEAVREAIAAARSLRREPTPPFYPVPKGSREEALACHASTVASFFDDARRRAWAARDVEEAYADLDPALERRKREAAQRTIRREAQARYGLDYRPTAALKASQGPPRVMLGGAQGVGKTRAAEAGLLAAVGMVSLVLVPDHAKAGELVVSLRQQARQRSQVTPAVEWVRGREAQDEGAPGITMCRVPKAAKALAEQSVSVPATLCVRCPFQDECGYMVQQDRLARLAKEPAGLIVVASRTYWDLPLPGHLKPDLVVLDEAPPNLGYKAVSVSFDTLGQPLTYDGPKRRKGRVAETAEAADAMAALLADVRPTLVAIRDAFQGTPDTVLRVLRERGIDEAQLDRVLASLSLYEDRVMGERLGAQIAAFTFTTCDRHPLDLERRLVATIDGHQSKQLRAIRRLIEALQLELGHGRDEPVAVLRSEDVGGGRKGVVAHTLGQPHFGPEVPFLHLDGTGDHDIAQALFGPLRLEWHPVERRAEVTQALGKSFSRQSITGLDARGEVIPSRQEEAERLRRDLVALCHAQPDALVVATKGVIKALVAAEKGRDALRNATAHFGALRGMNTWENLDAVIVIGREQPPPSAVEGPGRALAVRAGDQVTSLDRAEWTKERRHLRMRDGTPVEVEVEAHPDLWADRALRQIREVEVIQAIDRVRPHFKETPVRVTLLCPVVVDVTVDRVVPWAEAKQGGSRVERALATGFLPLSSSEAARLHHTIWPNRKAAQRDEELQGLIASLTTASWVGHLPKAEYSLGNVPLKLVSYRRSSTGDWGGSRTVLRALVVASMEEAQAVLERAVGSVREFTIEAATPEATSTPMHPAPVPVVPLNSLEDEHPVALPVPGDGLSQVPIPRPAFRAGAPP